MSEQRGTPESVADRIADIRARVNGCLSQRNTERLAQVWQRINERLSEILLENEKRPQVTISLVGGTGAGKSTLLNALLDARILPVSSSRACTAAVCKVAYAEQSHFEAEVQFISREAWHRELQGLFSNIADAAIPGDANDSGDGESVIDISGAARQKLEAVYGTISDEQLLRLTPATLVEPDEVRSAFDVGRTLVASEDLKEFGKKIEVFLDSRQRFWPIVECVSIRGPFAALRNGATFVDLPGINDPNPDRERVTRNYLKSCRFVWIVFNIKRALTKDAMHLIQSDTFLRQVVMDGRADALTFVGTASDDIDVDTPQEFGLDDNATEIEILRARNTAATEVVGSQLHDLSNHLVHLAGEDRSRAAALRDAFGRCGIFTVAAREYLRLQGLAKGKPSEFVTTEVSAIPAVRQHMERVCADFGVEAQAMAHHRQVDQCWEELRRELFIQKAFFDEKNKATQQQKKEMEVKAKAAQTFRNTKLADTKDAYAQALEEAQEILKAKIKHGVDRARNDLRSVCAAWNGKHWATLRAIARWGGSFTGSTGSHDLPSDISKPILDSIAFAWTDFFGERLAHGLDKWGFKLNQIGDEFRRNLLDAIRMLEGDDSDYHQSLAQIIEMTDKIIAAHLAQTKKEMAEKIDEVRRELYDRIPEQVGANMQEAFKKAAEESGTGMKARMVNTLSTHAERVSKVMFQDVTSAMLDGVRVLSSWLTNKFGEMAQTVARQTDIAAENLTTDTGKFTVAEVENARAAIAALEEVLMSLAPRHLPRDVSGPLQRSF